MLEQKVRSCVPKRQKVLVEAINLGLVKAEWAPDGRHILCFSQWGVSNLIYLSFVL